MAHYITARYNVEARYITENENTPLNGTEFQNWFGDIITAEDAEEAIDQFKTWCLEHGIQEEEFDNIEIKAKYLPSYEVRTSVCELRRKYAPYYTAQGVASAIEASGQMGDGYESHYFNTLVEAQRFLAANFTPYTRWNHGGAVRFLEVNCAVICEIAEDGTPNDIDMICAEYDDE